MKKRILWSALTVALMTLLMTSIVQATSLGPTPAIDSTGPGLSIAEAGVGLESLGAGTESMSIDIGGPVIQATLYWAGRDRGDGNRCPRLGGTCYIPFSPYRDQELKFDGNSITGSIVGTESQYVGGLYYTCH